MKLDRSYYRKILETVHQSAPRYDKSTPALEQMYGENPDKFLLNLKYLCDKNLVECVFADGIGFEIPVPVFPVSLTADGLDYIDDQGGARADIDVIRIKFEDAQLAHIISLIDSNGKIPADQKTRLIEAFRSLPSRCIESLPSLLFGLLLEPNKIQSLLNLLQSLG